MTTTITTIDDRGSGFEPQAWRSALDADVKAAVAARAAISDDSGAFVAENYGLLKAKKLFSIGVPQELGGGGASHEELCDMIRELAHYCPSTALALSMHTHLVATAAWRWRHGHEASAALLAQVARDELVLVTTGANDWIDSNGSAVRVDGGYRVTADKRFASAAPAGDVALTSVRYDDPSAGPLVLHFSLPLDAEGTGLLEDWNTLGMRGTGSHTLRFEDVFVPDAAVTVRRPRGQWHESFDVVTAIALPIIMSSYVGLAEHAAEIAREGARARRGQLSSIVHIVGEMENALLTAQLALHEMIAAAADDVLVPSLARSNRTLALKTLAARAVRHTLDKAVEVSGGSSFFKKHPLERLWRDAQAVQFHPLPEGEQLVFAGRVALGLSPLG